MEVSAANRVFRARAAVVTVPLGVLQSERGEKGHIDFEPRLRALEKTVAGMRMGRVLRVNLRIDGRRWRSLLPPLLERRRRGFGFIHSRLPGVPVWWSLTANPVLTGWAGGPAALALERHSTRALETAAIESLSQWLGRSVDEVRAAVLDIASHDWTHDPFSRGAYTFTRAGHETAPARLRAPIEGTLFVAGEATADGAEIGTVHGALASGLRAAGEAAEALRR